MPKFKIRVTQMYRVRAEVIVAGKLPPSTSGLKWELVDEYSAAVIPADT